LSLWWGTRASLPAWETCLDFATGFTIVPRVFRKLGHLFVIVALIAATGGHWAVLQSVAWTAMFAGNLRTTSLASAVERTFDGQHPCKLCKVVCAGNKAQKKAEFPTVAKKIEFTHASFRFVFAAPMDFWSHNESAVKLHSLAHAPPVPPPRSVPG
jgi:hypothetical protein